MPLNEVALENAATPQAVAAQTAAQAEAAPSLAEPASSEPAPDPTAPAGAPVAAPAAESKAHSHTSTKREQQQEQTPAAPVLKPQRTTPPTDEGGRRPSSLSVQVMKDRRPTSRVITIAVDQSAQPQPVATTAPQQAVAPERAAATEAPVRAHSSLAHLAETARTVVRMAVRDGATQAHITLHPAELGEVSIRLRYHAGGISADVLAESHAAAQALQGAASELRRSLEAQGLVVHGLDVRAGEHEKQQRAHEHHAPPPPAPRAHVRPLGPDHDRHVEPAASHRRRRRPRIGSTR